GRDLSSPGGRAAKTIVPFRPGKVASAASAHPITTATERRDTARRLMSWTLACENRREPAEVRATPCGFVRPRRGVGAEHRDCHRGGNASKEARMCLTCGCMDAHLEMGTNNIRYEDIKAAADENGK